MSEEQGSLTAFLAVLAVGLFALVGLVVDGGRAVVAKREAIDVAEQAARVGADQLSVDALRGGNVVVDAAAASTAVARYLRAAGEQGTATVTGDGVTVQVSSSSSTVILGIVGISAIPVSASASATNVHGVTGADG